MQLTKNFKLSEFEISNPEHGFNPDINKIPKIYLPNVKKLAQNMQVFREFIGSPVKLLSGYRSELYNNKVSGASRSQHLFAKACDFKTNLEPYESKEIIEILIKYKHMDAGGLHAYNWGVHYDVRGVNTRW